MSRTSCIAHAPKQAIAIVRADYYRLMEKDACAAALLNLFEYWANAAIAHNPAEERPWVGARPIREFEQMLLGISSDKQIRKRLALLEARGFIQMQRPALRGTAKRYRVMVPEIQRALFGQMTEEGQVHRLNDQSAVGHLTERPMVKQPVKLRSFDQALKKNLQELKEERKEKRSERSFSSLNSNQDIPSKIETATGDHGSSVQIGTVHYTQPPESIDFAELWEENPVLARSKMRQIAPGHKRLEMLAHGFGHWWIGPGLNDFDEHLIQACRNRKRKFQQPDGLGDAKGYINNMLRNGDWGNFALRCEEAKALKEKMSATSSLTQTASTVSTRSNPFKRSEQERRDSALGLARFKVAQGEIERGREISRQFGFSIAEIGLSADVADVTVRHPCSSQAA